jgi:hypothetical protein
MQTMLRRTWMLAVLAIVFPRSATLLAAAPATNERFSQKEEADLTEILETGLKVRTPKEKAFIARVVETVEKKQLSEALVKAMFQRARAKHAHYPYPYFTAMMIKIAKQQGVTL